ncbi:hypothetical protein JCM10213_000209, partial [Rhodosporidiobolus nylandii]
MKYGKQYLESLESVPEEWRKQAIEYRKLKKVINRVASELKDLGLTSEVLKELLENQAASPPSASAAPLPTAAPALEGQGSHIRWASGGAGGEEEKEQGETRIEEVIDEAEGVVEAPEEGAEEMSDKVKGKQKAGAAGGGKTRKRRVRATYELAGTTAHPEPRIHLVFSSCSSESYSSSGPSSSGEGHSSTSEADLLPSDEDELAASPAKFLFSRPHRRRSRRRGPRRRETGDSELSVEGGGGGGGQGGDEDAAESGKISELPSSASPPSSSPSSTLATSVAAHASLSLSLPLRPGGEGEAEGEDEDQSEATQSESGDPAALRDGADEVVEFEGAGRQAEGLLRRMYGVGVAAEGEGSEGEGEDAAGGAAAVAVEVRLKERAEEEEAELRRVSSQETLRPPAQAVQLEVQPLSLGELEKMRVGESEGEVVRRRSKEIEVREREERRRSREEEREERAEMGDDEGEKMGKSGRPRRRRHRPRQHRREVFIPLSSDTEFLTLLASALNSLATLQLAQKRQFTESVRILADEVSAVSSPARPKTDLYIWREIFALWAEAAIFESRSERDRGERSTEDVEKKLEWFVDQVAKRKLAKRMRHKESRTALEKFIALNVELLDLKKFQIANEEAARKILKKHDKRTALTASYGFPRFLTSSSNGSGSTSDASDPLAMISSSLHHPSNAPVLTLPGFPSLPHILLSTFTTTLLPIIPALEDYECSICGDVAFKPIRLSCGHKFC